MRRKGEVFVHNMRAPEDKMRLKREVELNRQLRALKIHRLLLGYDYKGWWYRYWIQLKLRWMVLRKKEQDTLSKMQAPLLSGKRVRQRLLIGLQ